ncbi:MAG: SLBB domain-containing protein [Candidatus Cloacimonetes bacterium]|nr:SLBB domain-containing protein [Candidatus Cloacimonadota bacterium]
MKKLILFLLCLTASLAAPEEIKDKIGVASFKKESEAKKLLELETTKEKAAASQGFEKKIEVVEDYGTFSSITHLKKISPEFLKGVDSDKLEYFGHRLFKKLNLELSKIALQSVNVADDYKIDVGDRFSIHIWNQTQDEIVPVSVNSLGMIKFPLAGEIFVKGVEKNKLANHLLKKLSKYYKTLDLSFEFIKLRQFPVYVTGEVKSPGVYMANAMSTPLQLMIAAGGPTLEGSLRSLEIIKRDKTIASIDLYHYLLTGKFKKSQQLSPGMSLHVPIAKKTVAVLGQVRRVGVFELKPWEKLSHLVTYAGGVLAEANTSSLQLIRFGKNGKSSLKDLNFSKQSTAILADGDVLLVHPRLEEIQNRVFISGNIYREGSYEWTSKLTLKSLIEKAQGFKKDTFFNRIEISRIKSDKMNFVEASGLNVISNRELIVKALSEKSNYDYKLKAGDEVKVFHLSEVQNSPIVSISGEVEKPGSFPLRWNAKVKDVLILAKLSKDAHMDKGEIYRESKKGMKIIKFDVKKALDGSLFHNLRLKNRDKITVFKDPLRINQGSISISGEVPFPGVYHFKMGDTLIDVLKRAGGLTKNSYLPASRFHRKSVAVRQREMKERFVKREKENIGNMQAQLLNSEAESEDKEAQISSLKQVEAVVDQLDGIEIAGRILLTFNDADTIESLKGSTVDLTLEDGDEFVIPLKPTEISVSGQVYSPITELYRKDASLSEYITDAGGLTDYANQQKIYIIHASGVATPANMMKRAIKSNRYIGGVKKSKLSFSENFLMPGDFIVVPTKIRLGRNKMKETLDSVYKMAITVGALGGLF